KRRSRTCTRRPSPLPAPPLPPAAATIAVRDHRHAEYPYSNLNYWSTMEVTYLKAINQALHEEMRRDDNVFVMGEDVGELGGAFKVTEGLLDASGEDRVIDTPISEALIVGAGLRAATLRMRPVVHVQVRHCHPRPFHQTI